MQCVILAGGLGTRMKAVSGKLPKALLPVGDSTFIDVQLRWLKLLGATEAVLALGYEGVAIQEQVESKAAENAAAYPRARFVFDGREPLGTGGAVRAAAFLLEDDFIVTYGDSFLFVDIARLAAEHRKRKAKVTFSIFKNQDRGDASNVIYSGGRIKCYDKFNRAPGMEYIDYGLFAVNKAYFLAETAPGKFDLAGFLSRAASTGAMEAYEARAMFFEIGSPEGYRSLCAALSAVGFDLQRFRARGF